MTQKDQKCALEEERSVEHDLRTCPRRQHCLPHWLIPATCAAASSQYATMLACMLIQYKGTTEGAHLEKSVICAPLCVARGFSRISCILPHCLAATLQHATISCCMLIMLHAEPPTCSTRSAYLKKSGLRSMICAPLDVARTAFRTAILHNAMI